MSCFFRKIKIKVYNLIIATNKYRKGDKHFKITFSLSNRMRSSEA